MDESKAAPKKTQGGARGEVYDWIQCIIAALIFCVLLFVFVARMVNVVGSSMYPTLEENDKMIISNLFFAPKQGDIVVLRKESFMDEPIVKRVIATENQIVNIDFDAGIVYVDGEALNEPYINQPTTDREDFDGPITVPEGCVFVMGDNRNMSTDSRKTEIGMVDTRLILGKAYMVIYPLSEFRVIK